MADYLVGYPVEELVTLVDNTSSLITGAHLTAETIQGPDGLAFPWSWAEDVLNPGNYLVRFTPTQVGSYNILIVTDTSPPQYWRLGGFAQGSAVGGSAVIGGAAVGTSQLELIQMIADNLQDLLQITATANGALDGSTWIDALNASAVSPKSSKGSDLFVTLATGANQWRESRVLDSVTASVPTFTLTPALPEQVLAGDQADIKNLQSQGFRHQTYVRVINQAIGLSWPNHLAPLTYAPTDPFAQSAPLIAIPSNFTHIASVSWLDTLGNWQAIAPAPFGEIGWEGWAWDPASQSIVVGGQQAWWANANAVQITGYGKAQALALPTDKTDVDPMWIVAVATKALQRSRGKSDAKALAISMADANDAQYNLARMTTDLPADVVQIR